MTKDQFFDLAAQYTAMANSADPDDHSAAAKRLRAALRNEASALDSAAIITTLSAMEPHYEAMLSVVRKLKDEVAKQAKLEQIAAFADKALSIAAAFRSGNVSLVITSIDEAVKLVASARA